MNTSRAAAPHEAPSAPLGGVDICLGYAAPQSVQGDRLGVRSADQAAAEFDKKVLASAGIRQLREQVGGALVRAGTASEVSR